MRTYIHKTTELIVAAFERHNAPYDVKRTLNIEVIDGRFSIDCGPDTTVSVIILDDDNDVMVSIMKLISNIPELRRSRVLEACNMINCHDPYLKYLLSPKGTVSVDHKLPVHTPDEAVGEMAYEVVIRMMMVMDIEYKALMKAVYTDEDLDANQFASEFYQHMETLRERAALYSDECGIYDDCFKPDEE